MYTFKSLDWTSNAWIKFQTLPQYVCWEGMQLLIAICPSDGDVKTGGPLGVFREEQAMSRHRVSPSPFLSASSHTTHTVILTSTSSSTRNVVCPSRAWFENRPYSTPSIRLARNPKHLTVQWVGIGKPTHTLSISWKADGTITFLKWIITCIPHIYSAFAYQSILLLCRFKKVISIIS